jgi:hypothetical protein
MAIDKMEGIMADKSSPTTTTQTQTTVDTFLAEMKGLSSTPTGVGGRLIFALDATGSRQLTWDSACQLQAEMFQEAMKLGGLSVQLVYYRGLSECRSSRWTSRPAELARLMERIMCRAGETQIGKVLAHAKRESALLRVQALVFVGDAMEENPDTLAADAAELGRLGIPAFMFQEGRDHEVEQVFRDIAQLTHGAYCRFDPGAARQLAELLRAVAVFAAGGVAALTARKDAGAIKLLGQLRSMRHGGFCNSGG